MNELCRAELANSLAEGYIRGVQSRWSTVDVGADFHFDQAKITPNTVVY